MAGWRLDVKSKFEAGLKFILDPACFKDKKAFISGVGIIIDISEQTYHNFEHGSADISVC